MAGSFDSTPASSIIFFLLFWKRLGVEFFWIPLHPPPPQFPLRCGINKKDSSLVSLSACTSAHAQACLCVCICERKREREVGFFLAVFTVGRGRGGIVHACVCLYISSMHTGWDHPINVSCQPATALRKKEAWELTYLLLETCTHTHTHREMIFV